MKNAFQILLILVVALVFATACKDKDAEKRIAQLESRLAELEGKGGSSTAQPVMNEETEEPEGPLAAMQFESTDHDFGTIKEGEVVEHTYTFTNTGEAPLVIQNAQGSCGCTVPDWTKEPIPVGGKGFIKAKFDSKGRPNVQNKTVTVTANTSPKQTVLRFKAMVQPTTPEAPADGPVKTN